MSPGERRRKRAFNVMLCNTTAAYTLPSYARVNARYRKIKRKMLLPASCRQLPPRCYVMKKTVVACLIQPQRKYVAGVVVPQDALEEVAV